MDRGGHRPLGAIAAARTSLPTDAPVREATAQTLLGDRQALGARFVDQLGHPCRALARRLWHFQGEVLTCVRQPDVPADINTGERGHPLAAWLPDPHGAHDVGRDLDRCWPGRPHRVSPPASSSLTQL